MNNIISYIVYFSVSFLIFNEQIKRLGISPTISIVISFITIGIIFILIKKYKNKTTEIKKLDEKVTDKYIFKLISIIFIGFLFTILYPVITGLIAFEISVDSILYHLPIIHSISSISSTYSLNDQIVIYAQTFPRVGEGLSAIIISLFHFITPLQGQAIIFFILTIFSFIKISKLIGGLESLIMHILILSVPTIFLQSTTNYIDILQFPLFLLGISSLLLAKTKYDFLIGTLWMGLLGGLKLTLTPIALITTFLIFLFKKIKLSWRYISLVSIVLLLPILPVLIDNYIIYGSPAAPYEILIWDGWDMMKTNFLQNRPEEFKFGYLNTSGIGRFIYSHLASSFMPIPTYDARLGGGGIIFLFLLMIYIVTSIKKLGKEILNQINNIIKYKAIRIRTYFNINSIFYIILISGLLLIPETYWFRYIIVIFLTITLHIFFKISQVKKKSKTIILIFLVFISLTQIFVLKTNLLSAVGLEKNIDNFINFTINSPTFNEQLKKIKPIINDKKKIAYILTDSAFSNLIGNYIAVTNPLAQITYIANEGIDSKNLISEYDVIFYTGENLNEYYTNYKNTYKTYYIENPSQSDAVIIIK